jgi:uncharacterized membrane protein
MIASQYTLAVELPVCMILGILVFDLVLLLFNQKMTISRAVWRQSVAHPYSYGVIAITLICFLIYHLWS